MPSQATSSSTWTIRSGVSARTSATITERSLDGDPDRATLSHRAGAQLDLDAGGSVEQARLPRLGAGAGERRGLVLDAVDGERDPLQAHRPHALVGGGPAVEREELEARRGDVVT